MAITNYYVSSAAGGGGTGLTPASPFTFAEMITHINGSGGAGKCFNCAGTFNNTNNANQISATGSTTAPIWIRGCSSVNSITDGYQGRNNSGYGELITTNFATLNYTTGLFSLGAYCILENFVLSGGNALGGSLRLNTHVTVQRCRVTGTGNGGANSPAINGLGSGNLIVYDNDIFQTNASAAAGILSMGGGSRAVGNRIRSTAGHGIEHNTNSASVVTAYNLLYSCGINGLKISSTNAASGHTILNNTIYGNTGDGVDIVAQASLLLIMGNMITDNGGWGIDFNNAANPIWMKFNRFRDNTSGTWNLATDWNTALQSDNVTTDTGGPSSDYTDAGSGDFSLVETSPAVGVSYPKISSMGAFQRVTVSPTVPSSGQIWPTYFRNT